MRKQMLVAVLVGGVVVTSAVGCDNPVDSGDFRKDPLDAVADAVFKDLECQDVARPSTLARIRELLAHPSASTASAFLFAPQDLATLVSVAGPEAEAVVIVTRNVLDAADSTGTLLASGWDGVQCGEPVALDCTAGRESVAVSCDSDGPSRIDLVLSRCVLGGSELDGAMQIVREGAGARATFTSLSVDETKVIDGEITLAVGAGTEAVAASVRTADGLRIVDHGGPNGGLSCGEELRVDTLAFTKSSDTVKVELKGLQATTDRTLGVETFGEHLTYDGACGCPVPGSGIAFDVPSPLGEEDTLAHATIRWESADDDASCAQAKVQLDDWPTSCGGVEGIDKDCAQAATASTLSQILSAFCVTP